MKKKKIIFTVGIRPDGNKISLLYKTFKKSKFFQTQLVNTGQHGNLLTEMLDVFSVKPDYDLKIHRPGQTLFDTTSEMLPKLGKLFAKEKPDLVFSANDGTTSFVTALAAFYHQIPIAHVEAGLRTNNIYNPFPEEANRKMTSVLTNFHFAPTIQAKKNLQQEGYAEKDIFVSGNTIIDSLLWTVKQYQNYKFEHQTLNKIDYKKRKVIILTTHRRESWGETMFDTLSAIKKVTQDNKEVEVIFPIHPNKIVLDKARQVLKNQDRIHLLPPLSYTAFALLLSKCHLVITDSGGIQEEAPSFGKPLLVMRRTTERPEGIKAGVAKLVGVDPGVIYKETANLLRNERAYKNMAMVKNPYGDGKACERILARISYLLALAKNSPKEFIYERKKA